MLAALISRRLPLTSNRLDLNSSREHAYCCNGFIRVFDSASEDYFKLIIKIRGRHKHLCTYNDDLFGLSAKGKERANEEPLVRFLIRKHFVGSGCGVGECGRRSACDCWTSRTPKLSLVHLTLKKVILRTRQNGKRVHSSWFSQRTTSESMNDLCDFGLASGINTQDCRLISRVFFNGQFYVGGDDTLAAKKNGSLEKRRLQRSYPLIWNKRPKDARIIKGFKVPNLGSSKQYVKGSLNNFALLC